MEDSNETFGDSVLSQPNKTTREERISIRQSYRRLIKETQLNKEELLKPDNNGLLQSIQQADELFSNNEFECREAALDSRFMSIAVALGAQKTSLLQTDLMAFHADEFASKLVTFMEGTGSKDDADDVSIPESGWDMLGKHSISYFKSMTPALHPLLGAFDVSGAVRKTHVKMSDNDQMGKAQLPQHLTNYRVDQKEATPEEIERVYSVIKGIYADDPTPMDYFELVINPDSYGHTIENIFHLAFLVKDGLVRVFLNDKNLPVVEPTKDSNKEKKSRESDNNGNQFMVSMSMDEWEEVVDAYQLTGKTPYIKPSVIGT